MHLPLITCGQDHRIVVIDHGLAGGVVTHHQLDAQGPGTGFFHGGQGTEGVTGDARDFLPVENPVDTLDQVQVHHRIVGVVVLVDQAFALAAGLLEHQVGELRGEHFVDERAVIGRLEGRAAQDDIHLHRREAVVQIDKRLRGALPAANDRNAHWLALDTGLLGHARQVLGMVEHPPVILERLERLGDTWRATGTDHHRARGAHQLLAVGIAGDHPQRLDLLLMQDRLDGQHFFAIAALLGELPGDPAQIVVVLHAARVERAQVDKVHQAPVGLEVIDEGIGAGGVAQGHQILEEGNLQLTLAHQGIAMPAVVGLLVEKQHVELALGFLALLQGDGQRQVRRTETNTDQVVNRGRCNCLCHSSVLWISPVALGRKAWATC